MVQGSSYGSAVLAKLPTRGRTRGGTIVPRQPRLEFCHEPSLYDCSSNSARGGTRDKLWECSCGSVSNGRMARSKREFCRTANPSWLILLCTCSTEYARHSWPCRPVRGHKPQRP